MTIVPPHLLFVCVANLARSPLAQLTARALLDAREGGEAIDVASAGTWTPGGEPMWGPSAEAARSLGLDPSGFLSRQLTDEIVTSSTLILTATRALRDEIIGKHPQAMGKVLTWRELAWLFRSVVPEWDGMPLAERPSALPAFVAHYRSRIPLARGEDLDVEDPAGRSANVMTKAAEQTVEALQVIVEGLCGPLPAPEMHATPTPAEAVRLRGRHRGK